MVILKKKLDNLKPGRQYILSVRSKNVDLNVLSNYANTIRFEVPTDTTIPDALTNLKLFSGLENVMFVFDYSEDLDIDRYEYQLYENEDMSDEYGPLTGFADANIFTVRVSNLRLEEDGEGLWPYWGRVRTIDTSGNSGPWTPLVETDPHTPLIDNQYIGSLTASKITAGTIGAHTINLNGANSIIQSTTYDTSSGSLGWQIKGDGNFSLGGPEGINYDGSSITIGSDVQVEANLSADSITVGTVPNQLKINDANNAGNGGMTLGSGGNNYWYANGNFRVGGASRSILWDGTTLTVTGTLNATAGNFDGTVTVGTNATKINIVGTGSTTTTAIHSGTTGYQTGTGFWMDASGRFSLGSALSWNGTTLTISGNASTSLITGAQVNANVTSISGGVISTGTINLQNVNVQTGSSGARLTIDSSGIKAYDGSNVNTVSIGSNGVASFTGTITSTSGNIGGWIIGPDSLYVGANSTSGLAYINISGQAWFSAGVITSSVGGFGSPTTTGGATSQNTTTIAGGSTRGYLRNISYGASKPTSPLLGDIHFT